MTRHALFFSSVQKGFAAERLALRDFLQGDPLRRFFEPVLFEDLPASDRRADDLYLHLVDRCQLYVGLFGSEYGSVDAEGLSPCREADLPEPEFTLEDGFRISLGRPLPQPSSSVTTEETQVETEEETKEESRRQEVSGAAPGKPSISRKQILALLRSHPESPSLSWQAS